VKPPNGQGNGSDRDVAGYSYDRDVASVTDRAIVLMGVVLVIAVEVRSRGDLNPQESDENAKS
jgi:hypothetical protein